MKVVDMFSAGLPCLAISGYPSLPELVQHGVNGRHFKDSAELAAQIEELLNDQATGGGLLKQYSENLKGFKEETWAKQWDQVMAKNTFRLN